MTTDEQISDLQRQAAEADAARRHAQAEGTKLVEKVRALEAQLSEANKSYQSAEFWKDWCYPDGATAEDVQKELADYHFILEQVGKVYSHITNGRMSKPNYEASAVIAEADDCQSEAIREAVTDELEAISASETIASVTTWANETFGPATMKRQIDRAWEEFTELLALKGLDSEKLAEEAADVCICLYRVIGTLDPEAINKKMVKNRARKWNVNADGTAQHVGEA